MRILSRSALSRLYAMDERSKSRSPIVSSSQKNRIVQLSTIEAACSWHLSAAQARRRLFCCLDIRGVTPFSPTGFYPDKVLTPARLQTSRRFFSGSAACFILYLVLYRLYFGSLLSLSVRACSIRSPGRARKAGIEPPRSVPCLPWWVLSGQYKQSVHLHRRLHK